MTTRSCISPDKKSNARSRSGPSLFFKRKRSDIAGSQERFFSPRIVLGEPNDRYEKEADAVADHVVSSANQSSPAAVQTKCEKCEQEEKGIQRKAEDEESVQLKNVEEEKEDIVQKKADPAEEKEEVQLKAADEKEEEMVQTKANAGAQQGESHPSSVDRSLDSQLEHNAGHGSALSQGTRRHMEDSFGADFRQVNIHTDQSAIQMTQKLGAQAFTHGSDIYFNRGKYDPSSSAGQHLLAHELTHVVQQNSALKKKRIQRQLVFGSGYTGYPSAPAEVGKAKSGKWNPTTIDFSTNAGRSGGGEGAKDLPELIKIIARQKKGSIQKLGLIGHSNARALGLSGDVHTAGVPLTGLITEATLKANKAQIDAVKDRFADGAAITLFSCNSGGISDGLADVISEAFGVCVKGFKNDVLWCITFNESPVSITSRGNVFYENPNDPLAGAGLHPSCANFHKKVTDLAPDVSSCKGVKKQPDKKCISPENIPVLNNPGAFQLASFSEEPGQANSLENADAARLEGLTLGDGLEKDRISERPRVQELQERLNHHGALLLADGMFGGDTLSVLNRFQSELGLDQTRHVNGETARALAVPSVFPGEVKVLSEVEGLKIGDGLIYGTFQLRPRVSRLQQLLTIHGNFTKVDGMFGPKTKSALNVFQAFNNLSTSDVIDGETADALEGRTSGFCPFGQIPVITV